MEVQAVPPSPSSPSSPSRGIFISYRRADTGPHARLLQVQLRERFPGARVFIDLDSIEAGEDFGDVIRDAITSCRVMVALIGREWATIADEEGRRRLDDPRDYVRFEIRAALRLGIRVIPVLVDGARPVRVQQLPADLRRLARLSSLEMSFDRYQYDTDRLIAIIENALGYRRRFLG
jgi:TIR domain